MFNLLIMFKPLPRNNIKYIRYLIFMWFFSMQLISCATTNNVKPVPNTRLDEIINNPKSMTSSLKTLDNHFSVNLLYTGIESGYYKRFVDLKLENTTVIVASSSTKLTNTTFLDILSQSKGNSIGLMLFSPTSKIKRLPNMSIRHIQIQQINSLILYNHLIKLGYKPTQEIISRASTFYYKNETMMLIEYILTSINQFLGGSKNDTTY